MALGFNAGFEAQQNRSLIGQRNDLIGRQVAIQERAEIAKEAQNRFALTFDTINKVVVAGKDSGKDIASTTEAARQMAATLRPIADALGIPQEVIDAKLDAALSQPSSRERAIAEASRKAIETQFTEEAKLSAQRAFEKTIEEKAKEEEALAKARAAGTPETFQSPEGKLAHDSVLAEKLYGAGSIQAKAIKESLEAEEAGEAPSLKDQAGMRKEFTALSKDFIAVRDSFNRIEAAATSASPAGDLALMFNYMKMLDPASVVRESEFAQVAATGSFGQRLQAGAERFLSGKRLEEGQRADFLDRAEMLMGAQFRAQKKLETQFTKLAQQAKIDPEDVVIDFDVPPEKKGVATKAGETKTIGGKTYVKRGNDWFEVADGTK